MENILYSGICVIVSVSEDGVQHSVNSVKCDYHVCGHSLVFNSIGSCLVLNWASMKPLVRPSMSKSCYGVDDSFLMTGDYRPTRNQSFTFSLARKRLPTYFYYQTLLILSLNIPLLIILIRKWVKWPNVGISCSPR